MNHSEQLNDLAKALVAAQGEFPTVAKDSNNPFFKSKYAGLPEVMKTASPVLAKHGLAVSQFVTHEGSDSLLQTYLLHESGQYITHAMPLILAKQDAQGQGSAITYARRYSYMAVLGLVADEDDDGNAASLQTKKPVPIANAASAAYRPHVSETTAPALENKPTDVTITADQAKELLEIAKKKGHTERAKAIQFINEATGLDDFTEMPAAFYDSYKKQLINAGWSKPQNTTTEVDLTDVPF